MYSLKMVSFRELALISLCSAVLLALLWCCWGLLNPIEIYDSRFYLTIAEKGLTDPSSRVAPFIYRFPIPLLAGTISNLLKISAANAFLGLTAISAWLLLTGSYLLSRAVGASKNIATYSLLSIALSFSLIRFHLYWYALVDIEAYLLLLPAMLALWKGKLRTCLLISLIGTLFKEFLIIPGLLACVDMLRRQNAPPSRRCLHAVGAGLLLFLIAAAPRLLIPVSDTRQFISSGDLIGMLVDPQRILRCAYSLLLVMFPLFLLLTPARMKNIVQTINGHRLQLSFYLACTTGLAMIGGVGIPRFFSYTFPWMLFLIAAARPTLSKAEFGMAACMIALVNKIWIVLPNPGIDVVAFTNFYGGASICSAQSMLNQTLIMTACITIINLSRHPWLAPQTSDCGPPKQRGLYSKNIRS